MKREKAVEFFKQNLFLSRVFLLCVLLIKPVQDRLDTRLGTPGAEPDILYFSSPSVVKRMALGYENLLADFYWMRTIQYYGRRDDANKRPVRFKNLSTLLDITTTLDPYLFDAYRMGSVFLAEPNPIGAGQPQEAIKLLDKGISANPGDWRYWYDKGFIYYWFLKDFNAAGKAWHEGSRVPDAAPWMAPLAAMAHTQGGSIDIAIALWQKQYQESTRKDVKENAWNHLISFDIARDLWTLEFLINQYHFNTDSYPQSLEEVVRGRKQFRTVDPSGVPYDYDPVWGTVSLGVTSKIKYIKVPDIYKESFIKKNLQ
jgi:tetratricopeptide (TPR) repeat protein